jgi:hypothetical protein
MTMHIYGCEPDSPAGEKFYRNVWAWHSLWTYCEDRHEELAHRVHRPYASDGDGLDENEATDLGWRLFFDLVHGIAEEYVDSRNAIVYALPNNECHICGGSGVRSDQVGEDLSMPWRALDVDQAIKLGRARGWCNYCRGEGRVLEFERSHRLSTVDIAEFADFLVHSGGFEIY